jgi:hypothetical protein
MKTIIIAVAAALSLGAAIPAFAEGEGDSRVGSANSLPSGFYHQTPVQLHEQIKQEWFAGQTQAPAATARRATPPTHG